MRLIKIRGSFYKFEGDTKGICIVCKIKTSAALRAQRLKMFRLYYLLLPIDFNASLVIYYD